MERASPSASFASESSGGEEDEDEDEYNRQNLNSPPSSDIASKVSSSSATMATSNCLMRRYAAQSRTHVLRSTSISPLILRKQRQISLNSKPILQRPNLQSLETHPEKKSTAQSRTTHRDLNSKSQLMTTHTNNRKTPMRNTPSTARSTSFHLPHGCQLNDDELNRLYQLTLEQMHLLCIRYPEKSDEETRRIYEDILEHWNDYRTSIGDFWLNRLDTRKRQAIIKIVWNNVYKIIKQIWTVEQFIEHLSLTKHLVQLEQKLLANNGQFLWEICQKRQRYNSRFCFSSFSKLFLSFFEVHWKCRYSVIELVYLRLN